MCLSRVIRKQSANDDTYIVPKDADIYLFDEDENTPLKINPANNLANYLFRGLERRMSRPSRC